MLGVIIPLLPSIYLFIYLLFPPFYFANSAFYFILFYFFHGFLFLSPYV